MKDKHYLIVYDIRDANRLQKVSRCIESYAVRVQKSVFEGTMSEQLVCILKRSLEGILHEEDFILFFPVCEKDWQKRESFGVQAAAEKNIFYDSKFVVL